MFNVLVIGCDKDLIMLSTSEAATNLLPGEGDRVFYVCKGCHTKHPVISFARIEARA
jgi:hypothetical protein